MSEGPIILVIDDEAQIRKLLRLSLEAYGYRVREAASAAEGLADVPLSRPDLIILDLGLPDMDGLDFLKKLRLRSRTPVIVLSVRGSEEDKINLLDAGADDYVTKPFGTGELLARIRTALRHLVASSEEGIFRSGHLMIDFVHRVVQKDGVDLKLTPTEYSLLRYLATNHGKVLTHNQILQELWGASPSVDPSYLRVFMLQLRRKIEEDAAHPRLIITEPGVGYRLVVREE